MWVATNNEVNNLEANHSFNTLAGVSCNIILLNFDIIILHFRWFVNRLMQNKVEICSIVILVSPLQSASLTAPPKGAPSPWLLLLVRCHCYVCACCYSCSPPATLRKTSFCYATLARKCWPQSRKRDSSPKRGAFADSLPRGRWHAERDGGGASIVGHALTQ